jgi:hypothetical protein
VRAHFTFSLGTVHFTFSSGWHYHGPCSPIPGSGKAKGKQAIDMEKQTYLDFEKYLIN